MATKKTQTTGPGAGKPQKADAEKPSAGNDGASAVPGSDHHAKTTKKQPSRTRKDGVRKDGVQKDGVRKDGAQKDGAQKDGVQKDGARKDDAWSDAPVPPVSLYSIVACAVHAGAENVLLSILRLLPGNTGMAYICLCPETISASAYADTMSQILSMPIHIVQNETKIRPDRVYLIPADTRAECRQGVLHVHPPDKRNDRSLPLDSFLRSLADDVQHKAIAVLVSGAGADGLPGMKAVQAAGGLTFACGIDIQGDTAHDLLAEGIADYVLLPGEIAGELSRVNKHALAQAWQGDGEVLFAESEVQLKRIFNILQSVANVDFSLYKSTTIKRRIARRMLLGRIDNLADYVVLLKNNRSELEDLYEDLLINVTSFFRDPDSFEALKNIVFSKIVTGRHNDLPLRVWVAGCSSGEEAYSIAIALLEWMEEADINMPIQIFATDISERSIRKARYGVYPANIVADVSPERLRRYFVRVEGGYRIGKSVRDICVFARQDVTADPPFSNIHLVTCRNLLIYINPESQKKILRTLHYALQPSGFLMLGSSETIGVLADLFTLIDKDNKIYSRKTTVQPVHFETSFGNIVDRHEQALAPGSSRPDIQKEADRILLERYAPAGVLVDERL